MTDPIEESQSGWTPTSTHDSNSDSSDDSDISTSEDNESSESSTIAPVGVDKSLLREILEELSFSLDLTTEADSASSGGDPKRGTPRVRLADDASAAARETRTKTITRALLDETETRTDSYDESEFDEAEVEEMEVTETESEESEINETTMEETAQGNVWMEMETAKEEEMWAEDYAIYNDQGERLWDDPDELMRLAAASSSDTNPRVIRPPPFLRLTKSINEDEVEEKQRNVFINEVAAKPRKVVTRVAPQLQPFSYFSLSSLFRCADDRQLKDVDTMAEENTDDRTVVGTWEENDEPAVWSFHDAEQDPGGDKFKAGMESSTIVMEMDRLSNPPQLSRSISDLVNERDAALMRLASPSMLPQAPAPTPAITESSLVSSEAKTAASSNLSTPRALRKMSSLPVGNPTYSRSEGAVRSVHSYDLDSRTAGNMTWLGSLTTNKRRGYDSTESFTDAPWRTDDASWLQPNTLTMTEALQCKFPESTPNSTVQDTVTSKAFSMATENSDPRAKNLTDCATSETSESAGQIAALGDNGEGTESADDHQMNGTLDESAGRIHDEDGQAKAGASQPAVRLTSKIKGWTDAKWKKQGDSPQNSNREPNSLALPGTPTTRQPRRKRNKNNFFRSIARYVRNQPPTLPMISEIPDHLHDDVDDDATNATFMEHKASAAAAETSDGVPDHSASDDTRDIAQGNTKTESTSDHKSPPSFHKAPQGTVVAESWSQHASPPSSPRSHQEVATADNPDRHTQNNERKISKLFKEMAAMVTHESSDLSGEEDALTEALPLHMQSHQPSDGDQGLPDDLKSLIEYYPSSEVLNVRFRDTMKFAHPVLAISSTDSNVVDEMGTEVALSLLDTDVNGAAEENDVLAVDMSDQIEKADSRHSEGRSNQAFKNFFALATAKHRGQHSIGRKGPPRVSHVGRRVDHGIYDDVKPNIVLAEVARSPNPGKQQTRFSPTKKGMQNRSKPVHEKSFHVMDRQPIWTEMKSKSSISASSAEEIRSASNVEGQDGHAEQKNFDFAKEATKKVGPAKAANTAMRRAFNLAIPRKNGSTRKRESRESCSSRNASRGGRDSPVGTGELLKNPWEQDEELRLHMDEDEEAIADILSRNLQLQMFGSVEERIDASLKKAELIASHFGEDLNALLRRNSTSSATSSRDVVESESNDWQRIMESKIDDSLSKVKEIARRLGIASE